MVRNIGSYFKVVDADEHRIIEELRSLREKKRKDAHDITAADAAADDVSLRFLLVPILQANDLSDWLIENGGKFLFQHGWAASFWKRHNLVSRVVTTKMRIMWLKCTL